MKNKKTLSAVLLTSAVFLIIIAIMLGFYIKDPKRNYLYIENKTYKTVAVPREKIEVGEELNSTNIKEISIEEDVLGKSQAQLLTYADCMNKKAIVTLLPEEQIYAKDVIDIKNEYANMIPISVQVDAFATVANRVVPGEYVDINITKGKIGTIDNKDRIVYDSNGNIVYDNYFIVNSKKRIDDITDEKGVSIKAAANITPKWAIIYFTKDELDRYVEATKDDGTIFLGLYNDITEQARPVTYLLKKNRTDVYVEKGGN